MSDLAAMASAMADGSYADDNSLAVVPVVNLQQALQRYQDMKEFVDKILKPNVDFGVIPGTAKNTLLKPGAEKLAWLFGLHPVFHEISVTEDWTGKEHDGEPFFNYRIACALFRGNRVVVQADGSCNSHEKKYRYRWVNESEVPAGMDKSKLPTKGGRISEFEFALAEAKTSGQYSKPPEYWANFKKCIENGTAVSVMRKTKSGKEFPAWEIDSTMYAIPNNEIADLANTILKMAEKRALIAAVLIGANASEWFTQDMEDFIDGSFTEAPNGEVRQPAAPAGTTQAPADQNKPASTPPAQAAANKPAPQGNKAPAQTAGAVASGMMVVIGKTNKYPQAWAAKLMPAVVTNGKCNTYELDGILQKLIAQKEIGHTFKPEVVAGAVESYLNAKAANEDPMLAAHDFLVACMDGQDENG